MVRVSALKALEGDKEVGDKLMELMDAVDTAIPEPEREIDKPFLMPVEDVFTITGHGTVVTGRVERGIVKVSEEIEIVGIREGSTKTTVTGVEMFRKLLDQGQAGDNVGLLLRGIKREDVERGQIVVEARLDHPAHQLRGLGLHPLEDEGGRHAVLQQLPSQFYFRTTDVTGVVTLPAGTEMVMPGDNTEMTVELIQPIAMEEDLQFAIREGGRTVGGCGRVVQDQQVVPRRPAADWPPPVTRSADPLELSQPIGRSRRQRWRDRRSRIRLKACDHEAIDASARRIVETVTKTGARVVGPVPLPTEKNVYAVIRSPHKYKDSFEHFEMRTHKRLIDILDPTPKTVDARSCAST